MTLFALEPEQDQPDRPDTTGTIDDAMKYIRRGIDRTVGQFGSNDLLRVAADLREYANTLEARALETKRRNGATQRSLEKDIQATSGAGRREAKERAERVRRLGEMPSVAEAFQEGRITTGQVDAITRAANDTSAEEVEQGGLLDQIENSDQSRRLAKRWAADRDRHKAAEERAERQRHNRKANIWTDHNTGMSILHAEFDPITGRTIAQALREATTPREGVSRQQALAGSLPSSSHSARGVC